MIGLEEPDQEPDEGQGHGDQYNREALFEEIAIGDAVTGRFGDAGGDHVGRCADKGAIATHR